ncbi:MAG: tRNA 2-thiouridine(34) synthase MnmA [Candidatus Comchoanobacterales bacterium]
MSNEFYDKLPPMSSQKTVIVGLSGGVDSSVTAALCLEQGYRVIGLHMMNWDQNDPHCPQAQDTADARRVASQLNIPFHVCDFSAEYWQDVFQHFLSEYQAGRTPNPDILCNQMIKFETFKQHAMGMGADLIATGHYAQLDHSTSKPQLKKAIDPLKDQSYFLAGVTSQQFEHCIFPLGELSKDNVRAQAKALGLSTASKKDSTGICFIGERKFNAFIRQHLLARPGPIITVDGDTLGQHKGLIFHTIGQRKGLGIGGAGDAWYVVRKQNHDNTLIVAQGHDHQSLYHHQLRYCHPVWRQQPNKNQPLTAKIRYRSQEQECTLDQSACIVTFKEPQRAITPGQYIVFYQGDLCLGCGIIDEAL